MWIGYGWKFRCPFRHIPSYYVHIPSHYVSNKEEHKDKKLTKQTVVHLVHRKVAINIDVIQFG